MSPGTHLLSKNVSGYTLSDGRCLPCSGISGRAIISSYFCHRDFKLFPKAKILLKKTLIYTPKSASFACSSSSSNSRRNSDFSRQSKQGYGFSKSKNKQNQERENSEDIENSVILSSKNGPLLSISRSPRFQATATPGPREREIVELFRKVQAQLRERAAIKEEKKIEASQEQSGRGTVDSLLKLLRNHSVKQEKRKNSDGDLNIEQSERNNAFDNKQNSNFFDSSTVITEEAQESGGAQFTRPASNFHRKSPVPRVKYQPVYSTDDDFTENLSPKTQGKREKRTQPNPELESSTAINEVFDDTPDLSSDSEEAYSEVSESPSSEEIDLSSLKLRELQVLAKSRGIKGYSKLKKGELLELLSGDASAH